MPPPRWAPQKQQSLHALQREKLPQMKPVPAYRFVSIPNLDFPLEEGEYDYDITKLDVDECHAVARPHFDGQAERSRRNRGVPAS